MGFFSSVLPQLNRWFGASAFSLCLVLVLLVPASGRADEILTVDGKRVSGNIESENDAQVRIRTTRGLIVTLPASRIKSITRKTISLSEHAGDLALGLKNYEKALSLYRRALAEDPELKAIEAKISRVLDSIDSSENALYEDLFQNAINDSANGDSAQTIKRLGEIVLNATPGGTWERKARRALAYEYFKVGLRYIDRFSYSEATDSMERAIQADSSLAAPHLEYALLLQKRSNQKMKALKAYNTGLSIAQAEKSKSVASENMLKSYAPEEARLTEAKLTTYRFEMASLMAEMGKRSDAAEIFMILLEKYDLDARQKKFAGEFVLDVCEEPSALEEAERPRVLASLDRIIQMDPSNERAFILKGRLLLLEGKVAESVSALSAAIALAPDSPGTHLLRAQGFTHLKKWALARTDLEKELDLNPEYDTMCQLGDVLVEMLEFHAALVQYNLATDLAPQEIRAPLGHARAVRVKANYMASTPAAKASLFAQAQRELDELLTKHSAQPQILLERGQLAADAERFDEAVEYLAKAANILNALGAASTNGLSRQDREMLVQIYYLLAKSRKTIKQLHEALDDLSKALLLEDVPLGPIHQMLGEVERTRGNPAAAVKHFQNAIKAEPQESNHELRLAMLFDEYLKKPTEAIPHYEAFLAKGGANERVRTRLQDCRITVEEKDAGKKDNTSPTSSTITVDE